MPNKLPTWNLSDLYSSIQDPQIQRDQASVEKQVIRLETKYRDFLGPVTPSKDIRHVLQIYEKILASIHKIHAFARLEHATHQNDQSYGSFAHNIFTWGTDMRNRLLFIEIEIASLPNVRLSELKKDKELVDYRHFLKRQQDFKPHYLPEREEQLIREKTLTGRSAFIRLYEQQTSNQVFALRTNSTTKRMYQSEILALVHHPSRNVRRTASQTFSKQLRKDAEIPTFALNMISQDWDLEAKRRNFPSVEMIRHTENEVDQSVVDALVKTVRSHYSVVSDYYSFKAELLGYQSLHEYDRYAPVEEVSQTFSYNEAIEIILTSFNAFSPEFGKIAKQFFNNRWIDAAPRKGKRGGAFCSYVTPDAHPYILTNYHGNVRDVLVLAHELGHGINGYLARKQSYLHFDWPLTLAETASVFSEMIVFYALVNQLPRKQQLALYTMKIESIFATAFRQISMYLFEKKLHRKRKLEGELSTEQINRIWRETQLEMYGDSLELTPDEDIRWSYVSHFYHSPFYVYAYSFGELLTLSLYDMYTTDDASFVPKYIDLLSAGGSASPHKLLSTFGVDIHDTEFWMKGMHEVQALIQQTKKLHST